MVRKIVLLTLFMFCGAEMTAYRTTIDEDRVTIEDHNHPHDGHFCPPGQAKKGNC